MVKKLLGLIKRELLNVRDNYRYPYRRITELPKCRPSVESVYYFINQLGRHQPVGLTHTIATGYHELPFPSLRFKSSRSDLKKRLTRLGSIYDVSGKYGIDIGCAIGGLTFGLQQREAHMVGVDRDAPCIAVASECEDLFKTGAKFACGAFDEDLLLHLVRTYSNPDTGRFDFAIWFSSFNWVADALGAAKMHSLLHAFSDHVDNLIADSAIGGKGAGALSSIGVTSNETFVEFVINNSSYTKAEQVGIDVDWYGRNVYLFSR